MARIEQQRKVLRKHENSSFVAVGSHVFKTSKS